MKKIAKVLIPLFLSFVLLTTVSLADDCGPKPTLSHTVISTPKYTSVGTQSDGSYLLPNGQVVLNTGRIVPNRNQLKYSYSSTDSTTYKWKIGRYNLCEVNSIPKSDIPFVVPKLKLNLTPMSQALLREFN